MAAVNSSSISIMLCSALAAGGGNVRLKINQTLKNKCVAGAGLSQLLRYDSFLYLF